MKVVDELTIGRASAPKVSQDPVLDEKQWDAITVGVEVANLYGFVHDTDGDPLAAVSITLNGHETASMIDGTFWILEIEPGDYTITGTKEGYKDYSKTISLAGGRNDEDIKMLREDEEEGWWQKLKDWWAGLETWEKGTIAGTGVVLGVGIGLAVTKGKERSKLKGGE